LLPHQTLVAVVTLPGDLFYPVGVTTVGVFVRKGVPHPRTISRVSTDNGLVGFFEQPPGARIYKPGTLTVSTVTGDAFLQPIPFIATDNVVLCTPKENYSELRLSTLLFIQVMLNEVKWRYSYGRQCYMGKFASTEIMLPVNRADDLDEDYMASVVEMATYWPFVAAVFSK
jgi:hypothetical protein